MPALGSRVLVPANISFQEENSAPEGLERGQGFPFNTSGGRSEKCRYFTFPEVAEQHSCQAVRSGRKANADRRVRFLSS